MLRSRLHDDLADLDAAGKENVVKLFFEQGFIGLSSSPNHGNEGRLENISNQRFYDGGRVRRVLRRFQNRAIPRRDTAD
ncbi:hypothetical protein SDC9_143510 [bioreactor metagenome]|uniref:Uncharacterized protein n=1 Tax=bioreactor metagenome TaxID=1076179 RepID=A0A645E3L4_9ZZZZ